MLKNRSFLPSANEVCESYVFTPVSQSFCSRGGCLGPDPGRVPAWGECLGPDPGGVSAQHVLRQTPPPQQTDTAADSTHPTGMHSCCDCDSYSPHRKNHNCVINLRWEWTIKPQLANLLLALTAASILARSSASLNMSSAAWWWGTTSGGFSPSFWNISGLRGPGGLFYDRKPVVGSNFSNLKFTLHVTRSDAWYPRGLFSERPKIITGFSPKVWLLIAIVFYDNDTDHVDLVAKRLPRQRRVVDLSL